MIEHNKVTLAREHVINGTRAIISEPARTFLSLSLSLSPSLSLPCTDYKNVTDSSVRGGHGATRQKGAVKFWAHWQRRVNGGRGESAAATAAAMTAASERAKRLLR